MPRSRRREQHDSQAVRSARMKASVKAPTLKMNESNDVVEGAWTLANHNDGVVRASLRGGGGGELENCFARVTPTKPR